jgi:hypothetical protein
VLFLEGGHVAHLTVNDSEFPYIPQWITIFILLLMFSVDFYQNWLERKREQQPVELRRRKKLRHRNVEPSQGDVWRQCGARVPRASGLWRD